MAQKQLKRPNIKLKNHASKHLEALLNQAIAANQDKKTKVLKYLIQAEKNWQVLCKVQTPHKTKLAGRLAFVTVTNANSTMHLVLDREKMETTLLKYSRTHFA